MTPTTSRRVRLGSPVVVRRQDFCFILAWRRELRRVEFFESIKAFAVVVRLALEGRIKAHAKPPPNGLGLKLSNPKLVRDPRHSAHVSTRPVVPQQ